MVEAGATDQRSAAWSAIWIDLTDLVSWSGPATGVQRVVANLAAPLLSAGARGFRYDRAGDRLVQVEDAVDVVRAVLGAGPAAAPSVWKTVGRAGKGEVERLRRVLGRSPRLAEAWHQLYGRVHGVTAALRRMDMRRAVKFDQGDVVLVLGMPWQELGVLEQIAEARRCFGVRVVSLLYDLIPILLPHVHPGLEPVYRRYLAAVAGLSSVVVCISQTTERDFVAFAAHEGLPAVSDTAVIRIGDDIDLASAVRSPVEGLASSKFVLYVSTFEPRKNHQLLYLAWKLAHERGVQLPSLVLVGRVGLLTGDLVSLLSNDPDLQDQIVLLHDADDRDLMWLYENCILTVYPSVYEGWGLPVAESLRLGKPVVAARTPVLQELGGNLIEYFSPFDPAECLDVLLAQLDPGRMRARERQIAEQFIAQSWSACAEQFQEVLRGLVSAPATSPGVSAPQGSR